ncbi:hypothetical protein COCOBI_06-5290 [Coccomyxa sp. Obi]|nr:hypothetical protein COCOBI_06-5290 [Coccomyxa sp. Obi]
MARTLRLSEHHLRRDPGARRDAGGSQRSGVPGPGPGPGPGGAGGRGGGGGSGGAGGRSGPGGPSGELGAAEPGASTSQTSMDRLDLNDPAKLGDTAHVKRKMFFCAEEGDPDTVLEGDPSGALTTHSAVEGAAASAAQQTPRSTEELPAAKMDEEDALPEDYIETVHTPRAGSAGHEDNLPFAALLESRSAAWAASGPRGGLRETFGEDWDWMVQEPTLQVRSWRLVELQARLGKGKAELERVDAELAEATTNRDYMTHGALNAGKAVTRAWVAAIQDELAERALKTGGQDRPTSSTPFQVGPLPRRPGDIAPMDFGYPSEVHASAPAPHAPSSAHASTSELGQEAPATGATEGQAGPSSLPTQSTSGQAQATGSTGVADSESEQQLQVAAVSSTPPAPAAAAVPGSVLSAPAALGLLPSATAAADPPGPVPDPAAAPGSAPNPAAAVADAAAAPGPSQQLTAEQIQQRLAEILAGGPGLAGLEGLLDTAAASLTQLEEDVKFIRAKGKNKSKAQKSRLKMLEGIGLSQLKLNLRAMSLNIKQLRESS